MKNKMAKPLGMTPATPGRAAGIRIVIPGDLQAAYGGRKDFRISLGHGDTAALRVRATVHRAAKDAEFEAKRKAIKAAASLAPVPTVTPELSRAIAQGVYAAGMAQDDHMRDSAEGVSVLRELAALTPPPGAALLIPQPRTTRPPLGADGLTESEAAALAGLNASADGAAAVDMARRRVAAVQPMADAVARSLGLDVDWTSESASAALKASLEAHRKAWGDRTRRDSGEAIPTPPTAAAIKAAPSYTLRDVLGSWAKTKLPSRTLISKANSAITLIDECLGKLPLAAYTKPQGATVVAYMLSKCNTQKTALDKFNAAKALLNYAADLMGWIDVNPWRAHTVTVKKRRTRVNLPPDVLVKLFDSPLFKAYALPTVAKAGGAAAYWVPLLGLYTGARQSELCQLRIEDVTVQQDMGLTVSIMADAGDDGEDSPETTTKGDTTRRRTPIHSDLLALGFADYIADMKASGSALVFPAVKYPMGEPAGTNFTKWFSAYRKGQGVTRRLQDFHAFRHTARTRLTDAGVEGIISDALLGHTSGQSTGRKVYDHSVMTLRLNLEKLAYPELGLVRSYPVR